MTDYLLYGMRVRADIPLLAMPLPQMIDDAPPDLMVEALPIVGAVQGETVASDGEMNIILDRSQPAEWRLRYQRAGGWMNVRLRPGQIAYHCSPGVDPRDIGRVIAPPVLAIYALMVQRPMLHGAMLEIDGQGIALLGVSEAGKSTTTAALIAAGCRLVTEELILFPAGDSLDFSPGLPLISLSPSVIPHLPAPPRLAPWFRDPKLGRSKLLWLPPLAACVPPTDPVPLAAICLLDRRLAAEQPPAYAALDPDEALAEIAPHAYWERLQSSETLMSLRQRCAPLAHNGRCGRLSLPTGVEQLFKHGPALKAMLRAVLSENHP